MATRVIIRHLSGSKANQVEQFPIEAFTELSFGRDAGSTVQYDPVRDDAVSRKHALIKIEAADPPTFFVTDVGSRNGTLLNGERISTLTEMLPGDEVELGPGGPKFTFDVQPRPASLVSRTRVITASGHLAATRMMDAEAAPAVTAEPSLERPTIGRNTIMHMIAQSRQSAGRIAIYALAGILVVIGAVGGAVYYTNQKAVSEQRARLAQEAAKQQQQAALLAEETGKRKQQEAKSRELAAQLQKQQQDLQKTDRGMTPEHIIQAYGNATVVVSVHWRLYDREIGKPLFHKTWSVAGQGLLPAYVLWKGKIYRWLTTEEDLRTNFPIEGSGSGSGFVIGDQGLILTNKHVAAGWTINYLQFSPSDSGRGILFEAQDRLLEPRAFAKRLNYKRQVFDVRNHPRKFEQAISWRPEQGGLVFANTQPVIIGQGEHAFEGRDDELSVRFPGSRLDVNARLVRASTDADVALIQIDSTQKLSVTKLAPTDTVKVGERVVVLGYPGASIQNKASILTVENGEINRHDETIPEPTVTSGIISNIGSAPQKLGNITIAGNMGDIYQMTVATGPGNSGGPVFDPDGKVIGLFTYGSARETETFAVPIKYGRALLEFQRKTY